MQRVAKAARGLEACIKISNYRDVEMSERLGVDRHEVSEAVARMQRDLSQLQATLTLLGRSIETEIGGRERGIEFSLTFSFA